MSQQSCLAGFSTGTSAASEYLLARFSQPLTAGDENFLDRCTVCSVCECPMCILLSFRSTLSLCSLLRQDRWKRQVLLTQVTWTLHLTEIFLGSEVRDFTRKIDGSFPQGSAPHVALAHSQHCFSLFVTFW